MSYCKVLIIGNITRQPEVRYLPAGTAICEFSVAVNEQWKAENGEKREKTTFVDCKCWAKRGEVIAEHFKKGDPIFVEGRLTQETWDDKATGAKRSKLTVTVDDFKFIGGKKGAKETDSLAPEPGDAGPPPSENPYA